MDKLFTEICLPEFPLALKQPLGANIMMKNTLTQIAETLHDARLSKRELPPFRETDPNFSIKDAYLVQANGIELRLRDGEQIVGMKMGLTSEAKRKQMNLDQPVYGVLTDRMQLQNGARFDLARGIHPKCEPEIAFRLKKAIRGVLSYEEAKDSIETVCAAIEILDSRYKGFKYFSLPDVVADNSSSSHFVLGPEVPYEGHDLRGLSMTLTSSYAAPLEGVSTDISGDPILSLVALGELLEKFHALPDGLPQGSVILTGAATSALELKPGGEINLFVLGLPKVSFWVSG